MRTYEELLTFIEEENVEFIRLAYFAPSTGAPSRALA